MSFWKTFGFHTVSAIDTILDGGDFTLEQLLDEEEILQETKSQNKKLIDFLTQPASLKQLVIYITVEPETKEDETEDSKMRFKYPFLACEILASEVWPIIDDFMAHKELLEQLYSFLDKDPPLNPLLSSYSSRVAGVLLQKKVGETINFLKERKNIIGTFLKHVGNASVMDLLLKVISCEDTTEGAGVLQWLCTTDLISSLINKFNPQQTSDVHENAAQALVDIIVVSMNSASSPLIAQLESEQVIQILLGYVLSQSLSSSLLHGLCVITELLRRHIRDQHDDLTKLEELPPFLKLIISHLDKFHNLIIKPKDQQSKLLPQPYGPIEPLGFHKLKVIEFFASLGRTNYSCIDTEIMKAGIIGSCLELFFTHIWNNFLHSTVEQMISQILEGENEALKIHLLKDAGLLDRICQASKANEEDMAKPKGIRRGYMGHITAISMNIVNTAAIVPAVDKALQESEDWKAFVKGALATTRERESKIIGGYMPTDFNPDEDEIDEQYDGQINYHTNESQFREGSYSTEEQRLKFDDDDDEDEDDEDEEGVVVQSVIEEDDFQEEGADAVPTTVATEVWEEKTIEDASIEEEELRKQEGKETTSPSEETKGSEDSIQIQPVQVVV